MDKIRDLIFEAASTLEEDEVVGLELGNHKLIVTKDNVLVKIGGTWVSLEEILDEIAKAP